MRVLIPPNDATGWHEHNFDYVVVAVNGTKIHVDVRGNPQAIEGTMETMSKIALCTLVVAATLKVLADLRLRSRRPAR